MRISGYLNKLWFFVRNYLFRTFQLRLLCGPIRIAVINLKRWLFIIWEINDTLSVQLNWFESSWRSPNQWGRPFTEIDKILILRWIILNLHERNTKPLIRYSSSSSLWIVANPMSTFAQVWTALSKEAGSVIGWKQPTEDYGLIEWSIRIIAHE